MNDNQPKARRRKRSPAARRAIAAGQKRRRARERREKLGQNTLTELAMFDGVTAAQGLLEAFGNNLGTATAVLEKIHQEGN